MVTRFGLVGALLLYGSLSAAPVPTRSNRYSASRPCIRTSCESSIKVVAAQTRSNKFNFNLRLRSCHNRRCCCTNRCTISYCTMCFRQPSVVEYRDYYNLPSMTYSRSRSLYGHLSQVLAPERSFHAVRKWPRVLCEGVQHSVVPRWVLLQ